MVSRQRLKEFFSRAEVSIYKEKSLEVKKAESASRDGDPECNNDDDKEEEESNDEDEEQGNADCKTPDSPKQTSGVGVPTFAEIALCVRGGYFAWPRTSSCVLRDISMEVRSGTLNPVVGPSGSGKTALVSALLEEMDRGSSGCCRIQSSPNVNS